MKWILSTFVGFLLDMAVFETLITLLGMDEENGVRGSKGCCKRRGVYFDFAIYDKFYFKKLR